MMNNWVPALLFLSLCGCTAATPDITALSSNFRFFSVNQKEYRIQSPTDLNSITITANCLMNQTEFWYELPNLSSPAPWTIVPNPITTPFVSVTNSCASSRTVSFILNLSGYSEFTDLLSNSSLKQVIRFRDTNITGLSTIEEISFYSGSKAPTERFILGQGINNPISSGSFALRGRITGFAINNSVTSGSFTLRGRVVVNQ